MSYTTSLGFTPIFQIDQGDNDITGGFQDRLVSITVESNGGGGRSDSIAIVVDDRDWAVASPSTAADAATTLKVSLGYKEGALYEMGTFTMNEVTYKFPPKGIELRGNGIDTTTPIKSTVITNYDGKTLGEIITSIVQTGGVIAAVDPDLASKQIPYLNVHSSHMHLLQELERRFDALAKFQDGRLSFTKRGTGLSASGASLGTFVLLPEDMSQCSVTERNRTGYSKVRVSYLDRTKNQLVWLQNEIASAFPGGPAHLVKQPFASQDEAQAHANSCMASLNRGMRTGSITLAKGDPSIRAQQNFTIAGTRDGMDGLYSIDNATHTLRKDVGLITTIQFSMAGDGTSGGSSEETAPRVTGQTFVPSGDDYSPGSSVGAGGQLGHV